MVYIIYLYFILTKILKFVACFFAALDAILVAVKLVKIRNAFWVVITPDGGARKSQFEGPYSPQTCPST